MLQVVVFLSSGSAQGALYKDARKENIFEVKRAREMGSSFF
jgi:hypothetical protein